MADRAKKISELAAVTAVVSTDLFVVVANASGNAITSQITLGSLANTFGISNTSSANLTYSVNKVTTTTLSVGNTTVNTAANSTTITLAGNVVITTGSATTRAAVNTALADTGSNGSIYLSTAGKIYLRIASTVGGATTDWQRVTTTAVD